MAEDTCCTLVPYFLVNEGKLDDFKALVPRFLERTGSEPGCVHYAFSYHGQEVHCREGYADGDAVLAHLDHVGDILAEALTISTISRLEVHAPPAEIEKMRGPLADLNPAFFELAGGGIRR